MGFFRNLFSFGFGNCCGFRGFRPFRNFFARRAGLNRRCNKCCNCKKTNGAKQTQTQGQSVTPQNQNKLKMNSVSIFNPKTNGTENLTGSQDNYYSDISAKTKATEGVVERVTANVEGQFASDTAQEAFMGDIFAKQVGTWTNEKGETAGGGAAFEKTEAYQFALEQNNNDYTPRKITVNGVEEEHAYFDRTKSDKTMSLFGTEMYQGRECLTMYDNEGNVHYFDKQNNLSAVAN